MSSKFTPSPEPTPWDIPGALVPMKTTTDAMLENYPLATPERLQQIEAEGGFERRGKYLK